MVPFSNWRCEGANLSSRVIVFPSLKSQTFVVDQLCGFKLGILVPNLKTCIPDDRSHPYRKDRWQLHFILVVIQVERKTVMTRKFWKCFEIFYFIAFVLINFYDIVKFGKNWFLLFKKFEFPKIERRGFRFFFIFYKIRFSLHFVFF